MHCPKCGYQTSEKDHSLNDQTECPRCGVIYAKFLDKKENNEKLIEKNFKTQKRTKYKFNYKYSAIAAFIIFLSFTILFFLTNENLSKSIHINNQNINLNVKPILKIEKQWYEGGNLHNANVFQWKNAEYENKLATSADMAANHPAISEKLSKTKNIENLKPYAVDLLICIEEASFGKGYESMKISEIAAGCMILMKF